MGFLDDLLTGEGPSFQTRSLSTISPEQREALNQLLARMQGQQPAQYGGQMSAGLSPFEQASLTALEQRSQALAAPDPTLQSAGGAVQRLTNYEQETGNASEFFRTNVQEPALQSFEREIMPRISRNFGGADFFSTERQASEGLAREDLLESLTAQRTAVELDQFNQSRNRAIQAAGLAPGISDAENRRTQTQIDILKAAGIEREVEQGGLDRQYAEFVRQQEQQRQTDDALRQLTLTPTIENLGMSDPGSAGLIATLLGSLAAGAGRQLGEMDWGSLLGRLFGGDKPKEGQQGPSDADKAPSTGAGGAVAGAAGAAGGTIASGAATPGGTVTITDGAGNIIPSVAAGAGAIAGGIGGPIASGGAGGLAGSIAGNVGAEYVLSGGASAGAGAGGAGVSTAAAESAGAAAGAPAGSGGSIASAVGTAAAIAGAAYGAYSTYQAAAVGDKKNAVVSGAATGAAIGSVIPVIGTAVGAVIGAVVGLVGAAFGDKQKASEAHYGSYKKIPVEQSVRGWRGDQIGGAMFEAIKSHTKSGNVNRYQDVSEMYTAFGITKDAHKNYKNVQNQMQEFIKGVVQTAQAAGGLPTDPAKLAELDGQQIYEKIVKPAMAAKVEEKTGRPATSNAWSPGFKGSTAGTMQNIFADYTDWLTSHWAEQGSPAPQPEPRPIMSGGKSNYGPGGMASGASYFIK